MTHSATWKCLSDVTVTALSERSLDAAELASAEAHLANCNPCLERVAAAANASHDTYATARHPVARPERFLLGPMLAEGAMGTVHAGVELATGRRVAIKRLKAGAAALDPELFERFAREAEILRQLDHPNIVKVLAIVPNGADPQIVMEYVSGGSLRGALTPGCPLPLERALRLTLELADALARTHHLGIVHRDIKPENILLAEDGSPRLTDFGVARLGHPTLTETGRMLGTIPYLSPEGLCGKTLDERADLWALGVVMFELVGGRRPFEGMSPASVINAILHHAAPELAPLCPIAPASLRELLGRLLEKEPEQRIASARQVGAELEAILRELVRGSPPLATRVVAGHEPEVHAPLLPTERLTGPHDSTLPVSSGSVIPVSSRSARLRAPRPHARVLPWLLLPIGLAAVGAYLWTIVLGPTSDDTLAAPASAARAERNDLEQSSPPPGAPSPSSSAQPTLTAPAGAAAAPPPALVVDDFEDANLRPRDARFARWERYSYNPTRQPREVWTQADGHISNYALRLAWRLEDTRNDHRDNTGVGTRTLAADGYVDLSRHARVVFSHQYSEGIGWPGLEDSASALAKDAIGAAAHEGSHQILEELTSIFAEANVRACEHRAKRGTVALGCSEFDTSFMAYFALSSGWKTVSIPFRELQEEEWRPHTGTPLERCLAVVDRLDFTVLAGSELTDGACHSGALLLDDISLR